MYRLKWIILALILLPFYSEAQTAYCGPFTAHGNISETGHSYETIRGDSITCGSSAGISLTNCHDITIIKCKIVNGTTVNGVGVYLNNCYNITIDSTFFSGCASGMFAIFCTGGIVFINNHDLNDVGPYPRGQMAQLDQCSGSGNIISYNISQSFTGAGNYEDHINLYKSNGTSSSYIQVKYNSIYGGGPSTTGSGITIADNGGSYQDVEYNTVVNCGADGMQVAGGTYIIMSNNTIYGKRTTVSHIGLGAGNYSGLPSNNVTMGYNTIRWTNSAGAVADTFHHYLASDPYKIATPAQWNTNILSTTIDSTVLSFPLWVSCALPPNISYSPSSQTWTQYTAIGSWSPTNTGGAATSWSITPPQPSGITFSTTTGVFTGTPLIPQSSTGYVVTATNSAGSSSVTVYITITASAGGVIRVPGITAIIK